MNNPFVFSAWSNFYAIIGTAAAALTGLMFVVVTLVTGAHAGTTEEGTTSYSTPTVFHFCVALLVAAIFCVPWRAIGYPAAIFGIGGLCGIVYVARAAYRTRRHTVYRPDLEDLIWYFSLPFLAYVIIASAAAALLLSNVRNGALFALAAAALLLIFIGIHNAWDLVTFIAIRSVSELDRTNASSETADNRDLGV